MFLLKTTAKRHISRQRIRFITLLILLIKLELRILHLLVLFRISLFYSVTLIIVYFKFSLKCLKNVFASSVVALKFCMFLIEEKNISIY